MTPPTLARALLHALVPEAELEFVAGDLNEEFLIVCAASGPGAGRRWYWSQVVRSAGALTGMRMRRGEIAHVAAAAGLGIAVPLLLLDRLWTFVYSVIPLKDGLDRAPGFLAANIIAACLLAAACGATARTFRRALAIACAVAAASALFLSASIGTTPLLYICILLACAPAGTLIGYRTKGRFS